MKSCTRSRIQDNIVMSLIVQYANLFNELTFNLNSKSTVLFWGSKNFTSKSKIKYHSRRRIIFSFGF